MMLLTSVLIADVDGKGMVLVPGGGGGSEAAEIDVTLIFDAEWLISKSGANEEGWTMLLLR